MKFSILREQFLVLLRRLNILLGKHPTFPILSNIMIKVDSQKLFLTATDLEVELITSTTIFTPYKLGIATIPGKKIISLCRSIGKGLEIFLELKNEKIVIKANNSYYILSTISASQFPRFTASTTIVELQISQEKIKCLIESVQFAMAYQDVRYYLNGILIDFKGSCVTSVATNGHRLASFSCQLHQSMSTKHSVIIPRKGVTQLMRMLGKDGNLKIEIGKNSIRTINEDLTCTSKLIEGQFPDYRSIISKFPNKSLNVDFFSFKQAINRVAIFADERSYGIKFVIKKHQLRITSQNSHQETAEENLDTNYLTDYEVEIAFNVNYIIDVLNVIKCDEIQINFTDDSSSVFFKDATSNGNTALYVVMPIQL